MSFAHPETGEILDSQEDFLAALAELDLRMEPFWKVRRALREEYGERFPATLPGRRWRSEKQEKIARCPRCGGCIESEEAL